jgi:hypothetical protein
MGNNCGIRIDSDYVSGNDFSISIAISSSQFSQQPAVRPREAL